MALFKKRSAKQDHQNSTSIQTRDESPAKMNGMNNKKSSSYIECKIQLLNDGEQPLDLLIKKTDKGQKLFDLVWEHLGNIIERDYFGLRYTDKYHQRRWLDMNKIVQKQLKDSKSYGMCFRVKHYPKSPLDDFQDDLAKRLLFLQIRRDLAQGRLLCDSTEAGLLGALVIQALRGDAPNEIPSGDDGNSPSDFWDTVYKSRIIFNQTQQIEDNIRAEHKKLRGQSSEQVIDQLLDLASRLPTYGIDPFEVKPLHKVHLPKSPENDLVSLPKDCSFYLGITGDGIVTFIRLERAQEYRWENIHHLACDGKQFLVYLKKNNLHPKLDVLTFVCTSKAAAIALWHWAVDRKCFFTLSTAEEAKKLRSAKTLFSRNHTFRFSGRSQHEINQGRSNAGTADRKLLRNLRDDQIRATFPGRIRAPIDTTPDRHSGLENIVEASPVVTPNQPKSSPSVDHVTNLLSNTNQVTSTENVSPKHDTPEEVHNDNTQVVDTVEEAPIEQVQVERQFGASQPQDDLVFNRTSYENKPEANGVEMDIHKRQEQVVTDLEKTIQDHSNSPLKTLRPNSTVLTSNGDIHNPETRITYQNGPNCLPAERKSEKHVNGTTKHEIVSNSTTTTKTITSNTRSPTHKPLSSKSDLTSNNHKFKFSLVMLVLMFFVGVIAILEATPKPNPEHNRNMLFRLIRANPIMTNLDTYVYNPVRSTFAQCLDSFWTFLKQ